MVRETARDGYSKERTAREKTPGKRVLVLPALGCTVLVIAGVCVRSSQFDHIKTSTNINN